MWISVEDKLPEEHEYKDMLVCRYDEGVAYTYADIYYFDGGFKSKDHHYGFDDPFEGVTHWMPLPEPPL